MTESTRLMVDLYVRNDFVFEEKVAIFNYFYFHFEREEQLCLGLAN